MVEYGQRKVVPYEKYEQHMQGTVQSSWKETGNVLRDMSWEGGGFHTWMFQSGGRDWAKTQKWKSRYIRVWHMNWYGWACITYRGELGNEVGFAQAREFGLESYWKCELLSVFSGNILMRSLFGSNPTSYLCQSLGMIRIYIFGRAVLTVLQ